MDPPVDVSRPRLSFKLPLEPTRLHRARQRIRDYLHAAELDPEAIDDIVLAVEEAMANAVLHSGATEDLETDLHFEDRDLFVQVKDHGRGFDVASFDPSCPPDPQALRGRGLYLIDRLVDKMQLVADDGIVVTMAVCDLLPESMPASAVCAPLMESPRPGLYWDERQRMVLEEIGEAFAALDWEFRYLHVNSRFCHLMHKKREELLGRTCWEILPEIVDTDVEAYLRQAMDLGLPVSHDFYLASIKSWFDQRLYPTAHGLTQFLNEANERKRAEQALRESEERYRSLVETMNEGYCTIEVLFDDDGTPADYRFLETNVAFESQTGLHDAEGKRIRELVPGHEEHWFETYGRIVRTGKSEHFVNEARALGRWYDVRAFRLGDAGSRKVAVFFNDITERKRAERLFGEREKRLRLAADAAQLGVFEWDVSSDRPVWDNDRMFEIFGLSPRDSPVDREQFEREVIHPDDLPRFQHEIGESMRRGAPFRGKYRIRRLNDDQWRWIEYLGAFEYAKSGDVRRLVSVLSDVTERVHAETALRESEQRYRTVGETIPYGVWQADAAGACTYVSDSFLEMCGMTWPQLQEFGWLHLLPEEDRAPTREHWLRCVAGGEDFEREHRFRAADGSTRHVLAIGRPVRNEEGKITSWAGVNLDITKRKMDEEVVRQAREDLDRAQAVGKIGWWRLDTRRNVLTWSPENYRIFGVPEGTRMSYESFLSTVHPDDREYVQTQWQAGLGGEPYDIEHRIVADGHLKWVREKAYLEFDSEGGLLGGFGITQDVTARKLAEERLRESEERFRIMADGLSTPIWVADASGERQYVNRAYREFFGIEEEQVRGGGWALLVHPDDRERYVEDSQQAIKQQRAFHTEARMRRGDGAWRVIEVVGAPRIASDGTFLGMVSSNNDVTERQEEFEEQARIASALQGAFLRSLPEIPGLQLARRSDTADRPALVGGDFSDAFTLPDGCVGLLIGDVEGKGIEAAGLAEEVRGAAHALAFGSANPGSVLSRVNDLLLGQEREQFVTLLFAVLDTETDLMLIASAAHPPPLSIVTSGARLLEVPRGPALGLYRFDYQETALRLSSRERLVFYTDGLTEARVGSQLFGDQRLLRAAEESSDGSLEQLLDDLLYAARTYAGELRDDVHLLGFGMTKDAKR